LIRIGISWIWRAPSVMARAYPGHHAFAAIEQ
jgi:hypothetical protein